MVTRPKPLREYVRGAAPNGALQPAAQVDTRSGASAIVGGLEDLAGGMHDFARSRAQEEHIIDARLEDEARVQVSTALATARVEAGRTLEEARTNAQNGAAGLTHTYEGWLNEYGTRQAETFAQSPPARTEPVPATLPSLLREADLETVAITPDSPAARKLIRELQLRAQTGASIVGIERNGANVINPGPDDELHAGDQILLLGTRTQLDLAKATLTGRAQAKV